ncbi:hypothetical protein [Aquibacillus kalidii]|uniref:hypothetical protein n=1 Tax=Aquibacillus kalidii TaxID=2762597 RepID=UPI001646947F|nr:hypothetical protein [Aquibacillus kalidii]
MFKIIALILHLFFIYFLLKGEKKVVKFIVLAFFTSLSIIFMYGIRFIAIKYHLYDGPVLDGGFSSLMKWVSTFSYLYIIPSFLIITYKLFGMANKLFERTWVKVVMFLFWLIVLAGLAFLSFYIFTLIFYGFAP